MYTEGTLEEGLSLTSAASRLVISHEELVAGGAARPGSPAITTQNERAKSLAAPGSSTATYFIYDHQYDRVWQGI